MFHLWETDLATYFDQRISSVEAQLPALLCNLLILQLNGFEWEGELFPDPKAFLLEWVIWALNLSASWFCCFYEKMILMGGLTLDSEPWCHCWYGKLLLILMREFENLLPTLFFRNIGRIHPCSGTRLYLVREHCICAFKVAKSKNFSSVLSLGFLCDRLAVLSCIVAISFCLYDTPLSSGITGPLVDMGNPWATCSPQFSESSLLDTVQS